MSFHRENSDEIKGRGKVKTLLAAAVFLLALSVYAGTLNHELVWDDRGLLEYIGSITRDGGLKAVLTSQFATHVEEGYISGYYRPVPVASLWLDTMYATLIPFQYHLVNILLHGINTILVFLLIGVVATRFAAVAGSAIFAVHPIHSESVSFVAGRTDLWAALFVLLSVFFWLRIRAGQAESAVLEKGVSLGAFLLACLSKEVAYMLPAVLLVWDAVLPVEARKERPAFCSRNRFWIVGWLMVLCLTAIGRLVVFGPALGLIRPEGFQVQSIAGTLLGVKALFFYLRLLVLPWPLKVFYSSHELVFTLTGLIAVLVFFFLFVIAYKRGGKGISVSSMVWVILFLLPVLVINLRSGALLAERFLYLPSVGFCLLAGILADTWTRTRRMVVAGIGVLLGLMILATGIQNRVWKDGVTLFTELTRVSPLMPDGYYNLGNALAAQDRHAEALSAFRTAVSLDPGHYRAYFNMGNSHRVLGHLPEAAAAFREALRLKPAFMSACLNLGLTYMEMERYDASVETFYKGLSYTPEELRLHVGLTLSFLKKGDRLAAEAHHRALEKTDPALASMVGKIVSQQGFK